eukprot:GHVU01097432.1.p1 GENE.GHVU01097432.1~~GHVU01097432.1.p1  ORF type:complete len:318 (+),score=19.31 GHVU01097432.1:126-1079(+)
MKTDISLLGLLACVVGLALLRGASSAELYNNQEYDNNTLGCRLYRHNDGSESQPGSGIAHYWPKPPCPEKTNSTMQDVADCGSLKKPCRLQDPAYSANADDQCNMMYYALHAAPRRPPGDLDLCGANGCHAYFRGNYTTVNTKPWDVSVDVPEKRYMGDHLPKILCPESCVDPDDTTKKICVHSVIMCNLDEKKNYTQIGCPDELEVVKFKVDATDGFNESCPLCTTAICDEKLGHADKSLCQGDLDCVAHCQWAKYFHCRETLGTNATEQYDCIKPELDKIKCLFGSKYYLSCNSARSLPAGLVALVFSVLAWRGA